MSQAQEQSGIRSLYDDPGLRDELIDEEADVLMKWGETQVARLAAQEMDRDAFDEAINQLQRLIKRINRLTARRHELTPEEQQELMGRINDAAQALKLQLPVTGAQIVAQGVLDNIGFIRAFTGALTGAEAQTAQDESPASPPAANPANNSSIVGAFFNSMADHLTSRQDDPSAPDSTGETAPNGEKK
jgi:hypothetical protein